MSERKLIQQLRDTIAEFDKHLYPSSNTGEWLLSFKWERPDIESQLDAADAYLAAPVAPAEPIGEVKRSHFGGRARNIGFDSVVMYEGAKVSPGDKVYAAPVAPALVPLTPDQRADLWRTTPFRGSGGQFDWFIDGVCAAERHHGIKP